MTTIETNLQDVHKRIAAACKAAGRAPKGLALGTLSMGMSGDLEAANHAGSTMVRIGTAIFGAGASAAD